MRTSKTCYDCLFFDKEIEKMWQDCAMGNYIHKDVRFCFRGRTTNTTLVNRNGVKTTLVKRSSIVEKTKLVRRI